MALPPIASAYLQNATTTTSGFNVSDILTVLVAVVSSLGAVTLSAYLAEYFADKRERKKARGAVLACLNLIYLQLPDLKTSFGIFSKTEWTEDLFPVLSNFLQNLKPIDTSPFGKIHDNLLNLDSELSTAIGHYELELLVVNSTISMLTKYLSDPREAATFLNMARPYFGKMEEFVAKLYSITLGIRTQTYLRRKKFEIDWDPLRRNFKEANEALIELKPVQ
jgi:hypothetical protein